MSIDFRKFVNDWRATKNPLAGRMLARGPDFEYPCPTGRHPQFVSNTPQQLLRTFSSSKLFFSNYFVSGRFYEMFMK